MRTLGMNFIPQQKLDKYDFDKFYNLLNNILKTLILLLGLGIAINLAIITYKIINFDTFIPADLQVQYNKAVIDLEQSKGKKELVVKGEKEQYHHINILQSLLTLKPKEIYILKLDIYGEKGTFSISGYANDGTLFNLYAERLKTNKNFSNIMIEKINEVKEGYKTFQIKGNLKKG